MAWTLAITAPIRSEAFTCNLVAAAIVQCVKGPAYTNGIGALGEWLSGSTFASYGDPNNAFSFASGLIGYPGGQAFPVTAGSGYTPALNYTTGGVCAVWLERVETVVCEVSGFA